MYLVPGAPDFRIPAQTHEEEIAQFVLPPTGNKK